MVNYEELTHTQNETFFIIQYVSQRQMVTLNNYDMSLLVSIYSKPGSMLILH